jgi:hypothetical protein
MKNRLPSSFRDPSGFIFTDNNQLYRQINKSYFDDFNLLHSSGLYDILVDKGYLVSHEIIDENDDYIIIKPSEIPYISYPYEWCFTQYLDAALLTLDITLIALEYGMILKDASAYNIQFINFKPILIDTLSFTKYKNNSPWIAYGQFCRHFLAPLALMSHLDMRLNQLMKVFIDGIPLDIASNLLPFNTRFNIGLHLHIHAHAKQQRLYAASSNIKHKEIVLPKSSLMAIVNNLRSTAKKLQKDYKDTEWAKYYENMLNYSEQAFKTKGSILRAMLQKVKPASVCDLGANTGLFSAIASETADLVVAYDIDIEAVDKHYCSLNTIGKQGILPLVCDLANPSPSLGWNLSERMSLFERKYFDCVLALAIVHHICISGNVPLQMAAEFFSNLGKYLIIEFVPKSDSQVQILLATREDIFPSYSKIGFEEAFKEYYDIMEVQEITDSERIIYLMQRRKQALL